MELGLKNRVALVCGASSGLGRACALRLAQEGALVAIVSRDKKKLEATADELTEITGKSVAAFAGNLAKAEDIQAVVKGAQNRFGPIDILVHNTGGPKPGKVFDIEDDDWLGAAELLLLSFVRLSRLLIPEMAKRNWGRVVSITSFVAKEPSDDLILSSAFRPGIIAAIKSLSRLYGKQNVLLNAVMPGAFATERHINLLERASESSGRSVEELEQQTADSIAVGHVGKPESLGDLVAFLVSERNQDITGSAIPIDGGTSRGLF